MTCEQVKHQFWVHNILKNQAKEHRRTCLMYFRSWKCYCKATVLVTSNFEFFCMCFFSQINGVSLSRLHSNDRFISHQRSSKDALPEHEEADSVQSFLWM